MSAVFDAAIAGTMAEYLLAKGWTLRADWWHSPLVAEVHVFAVRHSNATHDDREWREYAAREVDRAERGAYGA